MSTENVLENSALEVYAVFGVFRDEYLTFDLIEICKSEESAINYARGQLNAGKYAFRESQMFKDASVEKIHIGKRDDWPEFIDYGRLGFIVEKMLVL